MSATAQGAASPLAIFDSLQRGQTAPDWILAAIRTAWAPEAGDLDAVLIAVSENATFRVSIDGEARLVVRLHRPGYVGDVANVRSELQWVEALAADTSVRTPLPVRGADGELVQHLPGPGGSSWTAVAFEFVRGDILEDRDDQGGFFLTIGELTGVLHDHARSWTRPEGFRRFDWTLDDLVGPAARWGSWRGADLTPVEFATLERAMTSACDVLEGHQPSPETWGLIHSDLRPSNIMIADDELTIIDFDDSGFTYYLYDFASALTFYEHLPIASEMAANWLAGYQRIRPLTKDDLRAAGALSMVRRLTMLGWATTHREDALPADLWNGNLPGTVDVASRYLANPLWLSDPA